MSALREGDAVTVKPNPGDQNSKWRRGQIISKLGERSYLMDVNGRGYENNRKFLRVTSELPNTIFENTPEETLETINYDIENKAITQSPFKEAHSLTKNVQQEQKGADTKNSKLQSKSPDLKEKSDVPKERLSEGDGRMRNENATLRIRT